MLSQNINIHSFANIHIDYITPLYINPSTISHFSTFYRSHIKQCGVNCRVPFLCKYVFPIYITASECPYLYVPSCWQAYSWTPTGAFIPYVRYLVYVQFAIVLKSWFLHCFKHKVWTSSIFCLREDFL